MKFVHIADMHFDAPFVTLANKGKLADERRLEQRKVMKEVINYIKDNEILYFFITGDLYEQEYVKKSTIDFLNDLFKTIPNTKIFIIPGNHDPYINNSFYKKYNWNENVHIFSENLEIIEEPEVDIYGYGFNDYYMQNNYPKIEIKNNEKMNILLTHGSLDAGTDEQRMYNPLNSKTLKNLEFEYIALGHIHKKSYNDYENQKIVYPGSTISLGFDELGPRGMIVGEVTKKKLNLQFIEIQSKTFEEKEFDVTDINSKEDLIEKINELEFGENKFYKIILMGTRNFEIDENAILTFINSENIIKISNNTKIKYDIEEISKQLNLKGLFAKQILEKVQDSNIEQKEELMSAFEIGMDVLNKR